MGTHNLLCLKSFPYWEAMAFTVRKKIASNLDSEFAFHSEIIAKESVRQCRCSQLLRLDELIGSFMRSLEPFYCPFVIKFLWSWMT